MRAVDGNTTAALAADGDPFTLIGGKYLVIAHINSGSGLTGGLQALSGDATSYVALHSAFAHVSGVATLDLPPGIYKWVVSGTAGSGESFDMSVWRVPSD